VKNILFYFSLILIISTVPFSSSQTATIWGLSENYAIDYSQSGNLRINGTNYVDFSNDLSARYTIINITNTGYDYNFIGYNDVTEIGNIEMQTVSIGSFASIIIPTGDMPFMLPLSFQEEDDWITSFAEKFSELSLIAEAQFDDQILFNTSINDIFLELNFFANINVTNASPDTFVELPSLTIPEQIDANNTYVNSTVSGFIKYQLDNGILHELNISLSADLLIIDNIHYGSYNSVQSLNFMQLIPPNSIINEVNILHIFVIPTSIVISAIFIKIIGNNKLIIHKKQMN